MRTSYNDTLKSNGIKRIILILLVTVLAVGFIPTVSGSYAYADDGFPHWKWTTVCWMRR